YHRDGQTNGDDFYGKRRSPLEECDEPSHSRDSTGSVWVKPGSELPGPLVSYPSLPGNRMRMSAAPAAPTRPVRNTYAKMALDFYRQEGRLSRFHGLER